MFFQMNERETTVQSNFMINDLKDSILPRPESEDQMHWLVVQLGTLKVPHGTLSMHPGKPVTSDVGLCVFFTDFIGTDSIYLFIFSIHTDFPKCALLLFITSTRWMFGALDKV